MQLLGSRGGEGSRGKPRAVATKGGGDEFDQSASYNDAPSYGDSDMGGAAGADDDIPF
jgi:hypothetical protein